MEIDSIKKIVNTEKKAEDIKNNAKHQAETILDQAEHSKKKYDEIYQTQFTSKLETLKKELEGNNTSDIEKIRDDTSERIRELKASFEERCESTINKIFAEVLKF